MFSNIYGLLWKVVYTFWNKSVPFLYRQVMIITNKYQSQGNKYSNTNYENILLQLVNNA